MTRAAGNSDGKKRRPQVRFTWLEPGEWTQHALLALKNVNHFIGDQAEKNSVMMTIVEYAPNAVVEPHYHLVDYASVVVRGSIEITKKQEHVGAIRLVKAGVGYGPLRAGPEGCTVLDIFALGDRDPSAVSAQYFEK